MRDLMEVLRVKEQELANVKRQVEALRIALPLLDGDGEERALSMARSAPHSESSSFSH